MKFFFTVIFLFSFLNAGFLLNNRCVDKVVQDKSSYIVHFSDKQTQNVTINQLNQLINTSDFWDSITSSCLPLNGKCLKKVIYQDPYYLIYYNDDSPIQPITINEVNYLINSPSFWDSFDSCSIDNIEPGIIEPSPFLGLTEENFHLAMSFWGISLAFIISLGLIISI